jgi:hypothetical protein
MGMDTGQIKVEQLAETASQLPPLSQTTSQIIAILADPLFEVSELIKVIALDQPLTASLLRSANSASHSRTRAAATVGEAVIRLGSGTILVMAVVTSARPKSDVDLHAFGMSADDYWEHCVSSVAASEELSARRIARFGSGFSTAALLHDYGKLILSEHITPERLEQLAAFQSSNPARRPVDAERTVLGVDHAVPDSDRCSRHPRHHHHPPDPDRVCRTRHLPELAADHHRRWFQFALCSGRRLGDATSPGEFEPREHCECHPQTGPARQCPMFR